LQIYHQAQLALVVSMFLFMSTAWVESKPSARRPQPAQTECSLSQATRPELADCFKADPSYVERSGDSKKSAEVSRPSTEPKQPVV
jgi:hypothetical protein